MSEALEKLKTLGSQKIYMDTHIPAFYVQAILDENFKELARTQFFGFISILERDYDIDLEELKSHAKEYYDAEVTIEPLGDTGVLATPPKEKNFTLLYIIVAVFIFLLAFYYTTSLKDEGGEANITLPQADAVEVAPQQKVEEKEVVSPKEQKTTVIPESVASDEEEKNITEPTEEKVKEKEKVAPFKPSEPLEILPRSRVWLGYINVATHKKYQKTFSDELDLNASQEWLFISGHGYIDALVNGEKIHFSSKNALRLHYKDGILEQISKDEFKRLNRGRGW